MSLCHSIGQPSNRQCRLLLRKTQVSMVTAPSERKAFVLSPFQSFSTSLRCCDEKLRLRKGCGLVVRVLGLHAIAPGSKPVLTSGHDFFPVVRASTLLRFVNSKLVTTCQLTFSCFC